MQRFLVALAACALCHGAFADMLGPSPLILNRAVSPSPVAGGTITFTSLTNNAAGTQAALVGTYTGSAPSGLGTQSWGGGTGCSGTPAITSFVASGGTITANVAALATGDIGCTFTATGAGANTGTSTATAVVWPSGIALVAHTQIVPNGTGGVSPGIRTTGATLFVMNTGQYQGGTAVTPSDSNTNTWPGLTSQTLVGGCVSKIYYAKNATVGAGNTFTISGTGSASNAQIEAFSGVSTSAPFDVQNGVVGGGGPQTSITVGSVTPSAANSLIVAGACNNDSTPTTVNLSFTITDEQGFVNPTNEGGVTAYLLQGSASAVNPTFTFNGPTADNPTGVIAVFK